MLGILTVLFCAFYFPNIQQHPNDGYGAVPSAYLEGCGLLEYPDVRAPAKAWLLCLSQTAFGSINVIPFLTSAGLIPLTFLLARRITGSNPRALISSALLLASPILGYLGTTAALSSDWAFFMVLSMYLAYRFPLLAGPVFFVSVAAKGLPLLILPLMMYLAYRTAPAQRKRALISYGAAGGIILLLWGMGHHHLIQEDGLRWNVAQYEPAIYDMWFVFRSDPAQFVIIPAAVIIGLISRQPSARPMLLLVCGFYSLVFLLPVFSMYTMFDYRMIPLIVFAAITCMIPRHQKSY